MMQLGRYKFRGLTERFFTAAKKDFPSIANGHGILLLLVFIGFFNYSLKNRWAEWCGSHHSAHGQNSPKHIGFINPHSQAFGFADRQR